MSPPEPLSLAGLRQDYGQRGLTESDSAEDPIEQFRAWFADAQSAGLKEPNAMTLATAGADGQPSARIVLLKALDGDGFVFYTSYESRKGRELDLNPRAALVFYWAEPERQVRVLGTVSRVDRRISEEYFHSRPRGSQIAALASRQSETIEGRAVLERRYAELEAELADEPVPLPPLWGGYRLTPFEIEFWQGRQNRLHDRLLYRRIDGGWQRERLSP